MEGMNLVGNVNKKSIRSAYYTTMRKFIALKANRQKYNHSLSLDTLLCAWFTPSDRSTSAVVEYSRRSVSRSHFPLRARLLRVFTFVEHFLASCVSALARR